MNVNPSDSRAEGVMLEQLREERDTAREDARRVREALLTAQDQWREERDALLERVEQGQAAQQRAEKAERELGQYKMGPEVREIVARAEAAEQRVARWRVLLETSVEDWRSGQLSGAQMCEDIEYALQHGAESVDEAREKL